MRKSSGSLARPISVAVLVGLVASFATLVTFGFDDVLSALVVFTFVFLLTLAIGMSVAGRWPVLFGMVSAFMLAAAACAPLICSSGVNGIQHTSCQAILGLKLPGYEGTGPDFSPSFVPPLAAGVLAASAVYGLRKRRQRT